MLVMTGEVVQHKYWYCLSDFDSFFILLDEGTGEI